MPIRVLVNGAQGKMGRIACQTIIDHPELQLAAGLGRHDQLARAIIESQAQVVVDLTAADCVYDNTLTIIEAGAHPVIGTSGLVPEQIELLREQCDLRHLGGIVVPNFSIGAVLMMRFAAQAARILPDVEIIEAHHPQKQDAPSGTAIKTADIIAASRQTCPPQPSIKAILPHARGATQHHIPIHSLRLPGILAQQHIIFGNTGETLSITHNSIDRSSFMPGMILACQKVLRLKTLYYGLEHLID